MVYDYQKSEQEVAVRLIGEKPSFKKFRVSFSSKVHTGYTENDEVSGVYFEPRVEPAGPPAVLLHSWLTNRPTLPIYSHFAKMLATSGIPCILPALPYHLDRTPKGSLSGVRFLKENPTETLKSFRQAVVDIRTCLDWLEQRYRCHEFCIVGISLGAIIACICMGVDERLRRGVFILGGGDIGEIVWRGWATYILKKRAKITKELNKRLHEEYARYLEQVRSCRDLDSVKPFDDRFLFDPLTFAHLIWPRKVLMMNARFDPIIPRKSTVKLWNALGGPPIVWIPATHITSCFWQGFIWRKTVEFLKVLGSDPTN